MDNCDKNIAVGSWITAQARILIHRLIKDIEAKGGSVYYMDTDSVICDIDIYNDKELKEKYAWDGTGEDLGSLKNEISDCVKKNVESKFDKYFPKFKGNKKDKIKEVANKCNYIDELICCGLKSYYWESTFNINGQDVFFNDTKLKGYKQKGDKFMPKEYNIRTLEKDDYLSMLNGDVIKQVQEKFISNKLGTVQEWMMMRKQDKTFKYGYEKGIHQDNGFITPLKIKNISVNI